jgi:hypothetical protein
MCVLIFSTTFVWNIFVLSISERDMIKNVHCSLCKVPFILVRFEWNKFFDTFSKNTEISNFMKIRQVGAYLFHKDRLTGGKIDGRTEGRADMAKLIVAFRNFFNAPKMMVLIFVYSTITT